MKESQDRDTLHRLLAMLQLIPRYPNKITTTELQARLATNGFDIDVRSIQRDLIKLSEKFGLACDEDVKPKLWFWMAKTEQLSLPPMEPQAALVLYMAEQHLASLLPASTIDYLTPWFKQAARVLDLQGNRLSKWRSKVRVLEQGQPRLAPTFDRKVDAVITQGLLEDRRVSVKYQPRGQTKINEYDISPLGFVVRNQVIYIVCTCLLYTSPSPRD